MIIDKTKTDLFNEEKYQLFMTMNVLSALIILALVKLKQIW